MKTLAEIMQDVAERGQLFSLYQTQNEWVCNFRTGDNKQLVGRGKGATPEEAANEAEAYGQALLAPPETDDDIFA